MNPKKKRETVLLENQKVSLHFRNLEKDYTFQEAYELALKQCFDAAYLLLKFRPRSEHELTTQLLQKGFTDQEVSFVIQDLIKQKQLNDPMFVKYFLESYQKSRPYGIYALKKKLREKGIHPDLIEQELNQYEQNNAPDEEALGLIKKRLYKYEKNSRADKIQKINAYLYGRGYEFDVIEQVIDRLKAEDLI